MYQSEYPGMDSLLQYCLWDTPTGDLPLSISALISTILLNNNNPTAQRWGL